MLRKLIHIVLSLLLLVSTAGMAITKHYCGKRLESVTINHVPASCCNQDGCCRNESEVVQVQDNFTSGIPLTCEVQQLDLFDEPFLAHVLHIEFINDTNKSIPFDTSPPPGGVAAFLSKIQTYLI